VLAILNRSIAWWFVAAAFLAATAPGQDECADCKPTSGVQPAQSAARRTLSSKTAAVDPQLKAMISDADGVMPEFRADILLGLVESGKIADARLKKTLVNRAYSAAEAAQAQYGEAPYGRVGRTRQGRKAISVSITQLDRISLQSRAVHDMQSLSASRARAMFETMPFPALAPLSCDDNWIYDPGPFYHALTEVVESDFHPHEIASGNRLSFLLPYVSHLDSHAQVIPVAHLLATAKLTPEELRQLSSAYVEALSSVPPDGLTFAVVAEDGGDYVRNVYGNSLSDAMLGLWSAMKKADLSTGLLLRPLRGYLLQNFNGPRCNIKEAEESAKKKNSLPGAVEGFNRTFDASLKQNGLAPISLDELPKAATLPTTVFDPPDSYEDKQLTLAIQKLQDSLDRSTQNGQIASSWWRQLDDFLLRFYAWEEGQAKEDDYVNEKAEFYQVLVDFVPKSPERQKVLESFVSLLEQHTYQSLGAAEWFLYSRVFLIGMFAKESHDEIVHALLNSRDPVLNLYARLELWQGKASGPHWPAAH